MFSWQESDNCVLSEQMLLLFFLKKGSLLRHERKYIQRQTFSKGHLSLELVT